MMVKFFISTKVLITIILLNIVIFFYFPFTTFSLGIVVFAFIFFLFRKKKFTHKDVIKRTGSVYLSPVNGTIENIQRDIKVNDLVFAELTIVIGLVNEWGFYLPMSCQFDNVEHIDGSRLLRFGIMPKSATDWDKKRRVRLELCSKDNILSFIEVYPCKFGFRPRIWPLFGDRGATGACFGYMPFGGTMKILLPQPHKLFVKEGDLLLTSDTVVANLQ